MATHRFPSLDHPDLPATRDALHGYSRILGSWLKSCRAKRRHWWHASLRPSLLGLTTGVVNAGVDFELDLDMRNSRLSGRTADGGKLERPLTGQPAAELSRNVRKFLEGSGIEKHLAPDDPADAGGAPSYSRDCARAMQLAFASVSAALAGFRASIPEETSPIQVWPHHFDMSMLWLPGEKIAGEDPADEESSDKQMNFGFVFGDAGVAEPYFYVTAYPEAPALAGLRLPAGTAWQSDGFSGAVLPYRSLIESADPADYLLSLWNLLLNAGRTALTGRAS